MTTNDANSFNRLPDELLEYIFLLISYSPPIERFNHVHIPTSLFYFSYKMHEPELRRTFKDLLSLEKVCRRFYSLLRSSTFWLKKCHHNHVVIVKEPLAISQDVDLRRLYFSNPFHPDYNLLNLTGANESDIEFWSRGVEFEEIPAGCDQLYDAFGRISPCYATSHFWGHYNRASIPLLRKGEEKLISVNPVIEFSVCVAARWDCSSTCNLELNFSDDHNWKYQRTFSNGDCKWYRITYRYANYRQNQMPHHVSVHLQGKDRQFWAGHYGTKFAQIKLRLVLKEENETENQELEETLIEPEPSIAEELL